MIEHLLWPGTVLYHGNATEMEWWEKHKFLLTSIVNIVSFLTELPNSRYPPAVRRLATLLIGPASQSLFPFHFHSIFPALLCLAQKKIHHWIYSLISQPLRKWTPSDVPAPLLSPNSKFHRTCIHIPSPYSSSPRKMPLFPPLAPPLVHWIWSLHSFSPTLNAVLPLKGFCFVSFLQLSLQVSSTQSLKISYPPPS